MKSTAMLATTILALTILALTTLVSAESCTIGQSYCGWKLINEGLSDQRTITAELQRRGQPVDPDHIWNSLYACLSEGGDVYFEKRCGGDYTCQPGAGPYLGDHC